MANESFWSLLSCSGFSAKCIDFFYLLKTFLPLNSDKYFELFWCFVLGFPLSFYWLSGVKWVIDLGRDFWPSQLQFYPGVYVMALITLLTYPVSICTAERSFSGMRRLQTPLRRTMTEERLTGSLAILHMSSSYGRNWYWWYYNRVCLSVGYTCISPFACNLLGSVTVLPFFAVNTVSYR